jgi:hypothetical protein
MNKYQSTIGFLDLLFNMLLVFVALFLMAILLINPPTVESNIEKNVHYVVTIRWSPDTIHDVDLWITDNKEVVGFINKQGENFTLDRDDIGPDVFDRVLGYSLNEETISILAPESGTYTVNVHLYSVRGIFDPPIKVSWILHDVKRNHIISRGTVDLYAKGDERTLIRFDISEDHKITNIDVKNEYPFVLRSRRGMH